MQLDSRVFAMAALLAAAAGAGCTQGPVDVATLAPNSLGMGLVGHWTFDETAGATAHDSSGNLRDGAIASTGGFGGPGWSWAPGRFGGGLRFTGIDQVTVGSPPFPQATASYSVAAWLMIQYGDLDPPLAAVLSTESGFGGGWSLNVAPPPPGPGGTGGSYRFAYPIGAGPQDYIFADTVNCECFVEGAWTHIAAIVDVPSSTLAIYVNGVERVRVPAPQPIGPHQGTLFMGRWGPPGRNLAGTVDDVAIYSRALVPEEVALLASAPAPNPM
jgi:hypothetical protein